MFLTQLQFCPVVKVTVAFGKALHLGIDFKSLKTK